ncbi:tryptophan 2,3-dioxygenase [Actinokineospora globicatena]|uniref:Tryptophan 2,3-dioxygenase n=1 Tax=Actinokineospora globicatena TaxID=103729 RepID=A0A9W6QJY0_9PSEU|nr:tryptophan 2,3-dioxygenase family protein [Actinokineospora globicatena]MCP2303963.1 tryptophan 2,3-dioxygenase [Actinokineospora globicatena]GLW78875.1 tryptophan 2,3-dioxygenase [Actinokineospora globicatena]GLW86712.1 tryptophan 2,3-dioxygenase [Actinokineospora globicatena]GLW89533.1 tryptophan 2,3-dioxygenase [Actinokineospora globicatena]
MTQAPEYVAYARMDELHELQNPRSDARGELNFILISHVKELLFRAVTDDLDTARAALDRDDVADTCLALSRAVRTQRVLVACWESMNGMSADEFVAFRHVLNDASGVQSFAYRTLEFVMGNRPRDKVEATYEDGHPLLRAELAKPSLYDAVLAHLARQGYAIPQDCLEKSPAQQHELSAGVESVWLEVYRDTGKHHEAHRLAEALLEVAYQFSHWRSTHLLVVERMLGGKGGTGGSDGAPWLRAINEHRFFPELWTFRTRL